MTRIVLLLLFSISIMLSNNELPKNFYPNKIELRDTVSLYVKDITSDVFSNINYVTYFGGMIEHESCVTIRHPKCWSPSSELLTRWPNGLVREQGVGLGQITRAYSQNGSIRLDVLTDLRKRYPKDLSGLTWDNIKSRPDLQIRAISLLWLSNYTRLPDSIPEFDKVAMTDSAYNGGYGYIIKDRKSCGLKAKCNPDIWFNNVENINNRGNTILYGNRTANMINRDHVRDVLLEKWTKYYMVDWD